MNEFWIAIIAITATLGFYILVQPIHKKAKSPFTQPIIAVSVIMIVFMLIFNVSYDTYRIGGQWIEFFMGPAVIALAIPLYRNYEMLKQLFVPIVIGVTIGAFVGVASGLLLTKALGFEEEVILSIIPKSVTTPVAVSVAETIGGSISLAAVFVIIAGVCGPLLGPFLFKVFRLDTQLGRGIGMGSSSHAIGTAFIMDSSAMEGSISTVAMVLSAVVVSVISPILILLLL